VLVTGKKISHESVTEYTGHQSKKNQTIFVPHNACSYLWAFSTPFMQKGVILFSPDSGVSGQVGQKSMPSARKCT